MIDVKRFWSGDNQYFEELLECYGPLVLRICRIYARTEDHVQDLFQDTWMRVFENRYRYDGEGSFEGWLFRITHNTCRSALRAGKTRGKAEAGVQQQVPEEEFTWRPPDPDHGVEMKELEAALVEAIDELPRRARRVVQLKALEGMNTREVAEAMRVKPATVRSLLRYGFQNLRLTLEKGWK